MITDDEVDGMPIRIYQDDGGPPTGLVVYFHGGGFVFGSIGLMDNVARSLCQASGAVVSRSATGWRPSTRTPRGSTTARW